MEKKENFLEMEKLKGTKYLPIYFRFWTEKGNKWIYNNVYLFLLLTTFQPENLIL